MRNLYLLVASLTAAVAVPAGAAPVVQVLATGSSGFWQTAALGAWKLSNLAGPGAQHITFRRSACPGGCATAVDNRAAGIPAQEGDLWVVWDRNQRIWAYLGTDSVDGVRSFFAAPRTRINLNAGLGVVPGQNEISAALWGVDAPFIPAWAFAALNNVAFTTAFTDVRPEDAKYAFARTVSPPLGCLFDCLDYANVAFFGLPIESAVSVNRIWPIDFNLAGLDPISHAAIPPYQAIRIGAVPVVLLENRSNPNGLGQPGLAENISKPAIRGIFNGTQTNGTAFFGGPFPILSLLREPLSGAMNVFELNTMRNSIADNNPADSQEFNLLPPTVNTPNNPLNKAGGGGLRRRTIGTLETVNQVAVTQDSIGYASFGFGNVAQVAGNPAFGYLSVNGVDPIHAAYVNGQLPVCHAPCPAPPNTSFPNLRNGKYGIWFTERAITDVAGINAANTFALTNAIQQNAVNFVPDLVPFNAVLGDAGLRLYRSHYAVAQAGVLAPNNGLGGAVEAGGDMAGCIEVLGLPPGVLNCQVGNGNGPAPSAGLTANVDINTARLRVFSIEITGDILEATYNPAANAWSHTDVSLSAGAPAFSQGSPLLSIFNGLSNQEELFYINENAGAYSIEQLKSAAIGAWTQADITAIAGAPQPAPGSQLAAFFDPLAALETLFYVGADQQVHVLTWTPAQGWKEDLTVGVQVAAAGGALTAHLTAAGQEVFYEGNDQHVHELWRWSKQTDGWHTQDVTAANGLKPIAEVGSPLAGFLDPAAKTDAIFYLGTNQHLYELLFSPTAIWTSVDLTAQSGAPLVPPHSPLAAQRSAATNLEEVYFVDAMAEVRQVTSNSVAVPAWTTPPKSINTQAGNAPVSAVGAPIVALTDTLAAPLTDNVFYLMGGGIEELLQPPAWSALNVTTASGSPLSQP